MPNAKFKSYLHLHFLVFIAGFTAILGELISIDAIPLVWYRMLMASILMYIYIKIRKIKIDISKKAMFRFLVAGVIIALHWITFFGSIKAANVSIALTMFSTGAFFGSIIEPIIYKRQIIWYEIVFGVLVVIGVVIITQSEFEFLFGIILGIFSAFFGALFSVLNGKLLERHSASVISFYEFVGGVAAITVFIAFFGEGFSANFFKLSLSDFGYLSILASICTAYAFIAAVNLMKYLSPYTLILAYNLEPVYGIILALILFPNSEKMSNNFYLGAIIILLVVVMDGILKNSKVLKRIGI